MPSHQKRRRIIYILQLTKDIDNRVALIFHEIVVVFLGDIVQSMRFIETIYLKDGANAILYWI